MRRSGVTLLELILALALTVLVLGLVSAAVNIHLRLADTGRTQVTESQLARALLHRIADDLRNVVPYSPSPNASSGGSMSGLLSGGADTLLGSGFLGTSDRLQMDTAHMPRLDQANLLAAGGTQDPASSANHPYCVHTVSYYVSDPNDPTAVGNPPGRGNGLIRRDMDRALAQWAAQQGETDAPPRGPEVLAAEVVAIDFTYYNGIEEYDEWDSQEHEGLPTAVRITVQIRRPGEKTPATEDAPAELRPTITYSLLVQLPGAIAAQTSGSQTGTGAGSSFSGGGSG